MVEAEEFEFAKMPIHDVQEDVGRLCALAPLGTRFGWDPLLDRGSRDMRIYFDLDRRAIHAFERDPRSVDLRTQLVAAAKLPLQKEANQVTLVTIEVSWGRYRANAMRALELDLDHEITVVDGGCSALLAQHLLWVDGYRVRTRERTLSSST